MRKTYRPLINYRGSFALGIIRLWQEKQDWLETHSSPRAKRSWATKKARELDVDNCFLRRCVNFVDAYGTEYLREIAHTEYDTIYKISRGITPRTPHGASFSEIKKIMKDIGHGRSNESVGVAAL